MHWADWVNACVNVSRWSEFLFCFGIPVRALRGARVGIHTVIKIES